LARSDKGLERKGFISSGFISRYAMSMIGICSLCGRPASTTCPICGRLVCAQDSNPVTRVCRACAAKDMKLTRMT
jgi:hypothetical protein